MKLQTNYYNLEGKLTKTETLLDAVEIYAYLRLILNNYIFSNDNKNYKGSILENGHIIIYYYDKLSREIIIEN